MTDNIDLYINSMIDFIRSEYYKWKRLKVYNSPTPEFLDYGVEEQELFIKNNLRNQLIKLKELAMEYSLSDVLIIKIMNEINSFNTELNEAVEKYINKQNNRNDLVVKTLEILNIPLPYSLVDINNTSDTESDENWNDDDENISEDSGSQ